MEWIEEPLDMYAYDEQAELCRRSQVPIAGGELNGAQAAALSGQVLTAEICLIYLLEVTLR